MRGVSTVLLAAALAGCGAGSPPPPTPADIAYLAVAEGVQAHHTAALELLDKGAPEEAAVHLAHPVAELSGPLQAALGDTFADVAADLDADLRAVPRAYTNGASRDEVAAGIGVVAGTLERAVRIVVGDAAFTPAARAATAAALLAEAHRLLEAAVAGGAVVQPAQYEDAWGYMERAAVLAQELDLDADFEALRSALPSVLPGASADVDAFTAGAAAACEALARIAPELVRCDTAGP